MNSIEIVSEVLRLLASHTRPGISTLTLNNLAEQEIIKQGGVAINKGYKPEWANTRFPAAVCVSVNHEIAHGIPGTYQLREGDLVNFDLGVIKDGQCADAALSVGVGQISPRDKMLLKTAKRSVLAGINVIRDGVMVREIARAIEDEAKTKGFVVNRSFSGHAIGDKMHMEPYIYHATNWLYNFPEQFKEFEKYMDIVLHAGQVVCLEPMLTSSDSFGNRASNGWTFITKDKAKSAMFEHMIRVTKDGREVLTTHFEAEHKKGEELVV